METLDLTFTFIKTIQIYVIASFCFDISLKPRVSESGCRHSGPTGTWLKSSCPSWTWARSWSEWVLKESQLKMINCFLQLALFCWRDCGQGWECAQTCSLWEKFKSSLGRLSEKLSPSQSHARMNKWNSLTGFLRVPASKISCPWKICCTTAAKAFKWSWSVASFISTGATIPTCYWLTLFSISPTKSGSVIFDNSS